MRVGRWLSGLSLLMALAPMPAQDDNVYWYGDYRQAIRKAKETGKPLLVEFRCEA
jgi:hypothetical protein